MEHISFLSYLGGSTLFGALAIVFFKHWNKQSAYIPLIVTAIVCSLWGLIIAYNFSTISLVSPALITIEALRYCAIIYVTISILNFIYRQNSRSLIRHIKTGVLFIPPLLFLLVHLNILSSIFQTNSFLIYNSLLMSLLGLIMIEQLYRNCGQYRLIKIYSLLFASILAYDVYLFAYSIIFDELSYSLWQARGMINGSAALAMAVATLVFETSLPKPTAFSPSRPVAFYTTSLTVSIILLLIIAVMGYLVKTYGGTWGEVLHILLVFLALFTIGTLFLSKTLRAHTNVWINKHFFRHKYDYRVEWLKLINMLSRDAKEGELYTGTIKALLDIFKCHNGAIWLQKEQHYQLVYNSGLLINNNPKEPLSTPFIKALIEQEWVFSIQKSNYSQVNYVNSLLPKWVSDIPNVWLVLPLLTEKDLIGFVVLDKPDSDTSLNWEDLDLLKTVGYQLASYLDRQHAAEKLAESSQFETFNQLTAFIMHDLKNLIAQQKLIVENAAKHKDKPEFINDAFETIDNSVARMNNLLEKLQHDTPAHNTSVSLNKVAEQTIKKVSNGKPLPSLSISEELFINGDIDHLVMTLFHLIRNAQDATSNDGTIDVIIKKTADKAEISIIDNGCGMTQEFIEKRLFKPFITTKSGKGMGIGAYQTKTYIESLGGSLSVNSTIGKGSEFKIQLPLINH